MESRQLVNSAGEPISPVTTYNALIGEGEQHEYIGERIDLKTKKFSTEVIGVPTAHGSDNQVQGIAAQGDILIIGRTTESSGNMVYIVYKNYEYVTELLLPHTGYAALHSNTISFGESSQYNLHLLYASQWDGARACFVYEIDNSYQATLVRVIDPSNLTTSLFGAGYADWIYGDDYIYSIAYIEDSAYEIAGNGLRVCKFARPTGNGVIMLSDSDIIEHYDIEPCFIRQDSHYHNGKIYTLFGGTPENTRKYRRMMVTDVVSKKVVTICDMQYSDHEPEGVTMIDGELVFMHLALSHGVQRFIF